MTGVKIFKNAGIGMVLVLSFSVLGWTQQNDTKKEEAVVQAKKEMAVVSKPSVTLQKSNFVDEPREEVSDKTLEGEVSGVSPTFLAIVYGQDDKTSYEIPFKVNKNVRFERAKSMDDVKVGDSVQVAYEERLLKSEKETQVKARTLTLIRLLVSAKPEAEQSKNTLESREKE
jgi:hypothetical protein